jgi:rubrerythrin
MDDDLQTTADQTTVEMGETVYNEDGTIVGTVQDSTAEGFTVATVDDVATDDDDAGRADEEVPGQEFGEGYLMWRCEECGEMGEIDDGFPEECPSCGAPKELIGKALED